MALQLTAHGRTLTFHATGDLTVGDGASERVAGTWQAKVLPGEARRNQFTFEVDGLRQTVPARYAFTDSNQLQVVLSSAEGDSQPALVVGFLEIDEQHDIVYHLADEAGALLGTDIVLYGDLRVERDTNALVIDLVGGGEARIIGDRGIKSFEAAQNRLAELAADDLLRFRATTTNRLDDGNLLDLPAKLEFAGSWDIHGGRLVFLSRIVGDLSRPDVVIGFAGTLGAVTAGFVYHADSEGLQEAAFTIRGQHVWRAGDHHSEFNWDVSLGFSDKKFSAAVEFDAGTMSRTGREFQVGGSMVLKQSDGDTMSLALSLTAEYEWRDNSLVFKAKVNNEAGNFDYDLMLEGNIVGALGQLVFSIRYSNAEGAQGLTIALDFVGDRASAVQAVSFQLHVSPDKVEAAFSVHLSVRQVFKPGVGRVLQEEIAA